MRFLKKNNLYQLISVVLCTSLGYLQTPISPQLLISNNNTELFYSFEESKLSLYAIKKAQTYNKIWEYSFMENKNSELNSILFEDITGNGKKELVVILYAFGSQGEIYIFSTDSSIPNGKPDIYAFPKLKAGTKPTNAATVNWDGDKDYEILVSLSSPERKILIFDYNINQLVSVDEIGERFLGSTYGLIDLYIQDLNQDDEEDIIIYNNNQQPSRHIIFSTSEEENKTLSTKENIIKTIPLFFNNHINDVGISATGGLFSFEENTKPVSTTKNIRDILSFTSNTMILLTKEELIQINVPEFLVMGRIKTDIKAEEILCISNPNNQTVLCSNQKDEAVFLYQFSDTPTKVQLTKEETKKNIQPVASIQTTPTILTNQDTLFVNAGEKITIAIEQEHSIKSIETVERPENIELDVQKLQFLWETELKDIGEHILEYDITYNTNTIMEKTDTPNNQLAINTIETTENKRTRQIIYVNDPPQIILDNIQDTIKLPGTFMTNYIIEDKFYVSKDPLTTIGTTSLLIDSKTIYWEPEPEDSGPNKFLLYIDDGLATDTLMLNLFVDTTTTQIKYDQANLIATVNEEFLYQLEHQQGQNYEIINSPMNVRISPTGKIHWIPIITQIDNNTIEINVSSNNKKEKHTLEIYVNAPPVISYRPAINEAITQHDSLIFQCQSFDMNIGPTLSWSCPKSQNSDSFIQLSPAGKLSIYSDTLLDNYHYFINLTDGIAKDTFNGNIYINDSPKIISKPQNYLSLGDTLNYTILTEDKNNESPFDKTKANTLYYEIIKAPEGAILTKTKIIWVPTPSQIGNNNFNLTVTDSIETATQNFSIFVNDSPSIISVDSLSIAVGDTLVHYFNADDLNIDSELIYSIKTTINELLFSGKAGKLTWMPVEEDIGLHTLEINVSDGFSSGTDTQKLKIFVYKNPAMLNKPPTEAFVNLEYLYNPLAEDLFGNSVVQKDIIFKLEKIDSLFTGSYTAQDNTIRWFPTTQEIGERKLRILVYDQHNHKSTYDYTVNVLLSPCEPADPTHHTTKTDSIIVEKADTVYINNEKQQSKNTNDNLKWKPKGLGF